MPVTPFEPSSIVRRASDREAALITVEDGLFVLLDDSRVNEIFDYGASAPWTINRDSRWINGTETALDSNRSDGSDKVEGHIVVLAPGRRLALIGRAPPASAGHNITVDVNNGGAIDSAIQDARDSSVSIPPSTPSYRTWLTIDLPQSASPPHIVDIGGLPSGVSLDYAVVQVEPSTSVTNHLAIVDEVGKAVSYSGWERRPGPTVVKDSVYHPFGGSMHAAKNAGDVMDVKFVGSSISVYGMFPATNGTLSASYALDSLPAQPRTYDSATTARAFPNALLFSQSGLSAGLHTLTLTITENTSNESLAIDYFTYHPTFGSVNRLLSSEGAVTSDGGEQPKQRMSKGALAGMIVGVVLTIAVLVGFVCVRASCVRWVKSSVTMRRRKGANREKLGSQGAGTVETWGPRSPHHPFTVPGLTASMGLPVSKTVLGLDNASTSTFASVELKKVEIPPPSTLAV